MVDVKTELENEEAKRKELARVRIFWTLSLLSVILLGYLIYQIVILLR